MSDYLFLNECCGDIGPAQRDGVETICMLRQGHEENHVYRRDDEIGLITPDGNMTLKELRQRNRAN